MIAVDELAHGLLGPQTQQLGAGTTGVRSRRGRREPEPVSGGAFDHGIVQPPAQPGTPCAPARARPLPTPAGTLLESGDGSVMADLRGRRRVPGLLEPGSGIHGRRRDPRPGRGSQRDLPRAGRRRGHARVLPVGYAGRAPVPALSGRRRRRSQCWPQRRRQRRTGGVVTELTVRLTSSAASGQGPGRMRRRGARAAAHRRQFGGRHDRVAPRDPAR